MCVLPNPPRPKRPMGQEQRLLYMPKEQPNGTNQGRNDQETHDQPADQSTAGKQARQSHGTGQVKLIGQVQLMRQGRATTRKSEAITCWPLIPCLLSGRQLTHQSIAASMAKLSCGTVAPTICVGWRYTAGSFLFHFQCHHHLILCSIKPSSSRACTSAFSEPANLVAFKGLVATEFQECSPLKMACLVISHSRFVPMRPVLQSCNSALNKAMKWAVLLNGTSTSKGSHL